MFYNCLSTLGLSDKQRLPLVRVIGRSPLFSAVVMRDRAPVGPQDPVSPTEGSGTTEGDVVDWKLYLL